MTAGVSPSIVTVFDGLIGRNPDSVTIGPGIVPIINEIRGSQCGDRLRDLRRRIALSRASLSEQAGVSEASIRRAEQDPGDVPIGALVALCDVICIKLAEDLGWPDDDATEQAELRAVRQNNLVGKAVRACMWLVQNPEKVSEWVKVFGMPGESGN